MDTEQYIDGSMRTDLAGCVPRGVGVDVDVDMGARCDSQPRVYQSMSDGHRNTNHLLRGTPAQGTGKEGFRRMLAKSPPPAVRWQHPYQNSQSVGRPVHPPSSVDEIQAHGRYVRPVYPLYILFMESTGHSSHKPT